MSIGLGLQSLSDEDVVDTLLPRCLLTMCCEVDVCSLNCTSSHDAADLARALNLISYIILQIIFSLLQTCIVAAQPIRKLIDYIGHIILVMKSFEGRVIASQAFKEGASPQHAQISKIRLVH